jgi:hypothetical protein
MSGINLNSPSQQARVADIATTSTSEQRLELTSEILNKKLQLIIARSKSHPFDVNERIPDLDGLSVIVFLGSYLASEVQDLTGLTDKSNKTRDEMTSTQESLSQAAISTHLKKSWYTNLVEKIEIFRGKISGLPLKDPRSTETPTSSKIEIASLHAAKLDALKKQLSELDRSTTQHLEKTCEKIRQIFSGARFYISNLAEDRTLIEALLIRSGDMRPAGISYPDHDFLEIRDLANNQDEIETQAYILNDTAPELGEADPQTDQESVLYEGDNITRQKFRSVFSPEEIKGRSGLAARFLVERLLARGVKIEVDQHASRNGKLFIEVSGFCYLLEPRDGYVPRGIWTITEWDKSAPDQGSVLTMDAGTTSIEEITPDSAMIGTNLLLREVDRLIARDARATYSAALEIIRTHETQSIIDGEEALQEILNDTSDKSISARVTAAGGEIIRLSDPDTPDSQLNQEIYICYPNFTVFISRDVDSSVERRSEDGAQSPKWPSWSIQITKDSRAEFNLFDQHHVNKRNLKPTIESILDEIEIQREKLSR